MLRPNFLLLCFLLQFTLLTSAPAEQKLNRESDSVYICSFNVYKLGAVSPKYRSLDDEDEDDVESDEWGIPERIKNLARVLSYGSFDLIVLQEVHSGESGKWALADLAQELQKTHGIEYKHFLSPHIGQGLIPEAIAFLYNPKTIQPEIIDGTTTLVDTIEIEGRDLARTQWKSGDFDFTLVAAHLAWGSKPDREDGYRKVYEILTTPTPSAYSHDPDIIVLGDFNRFGLRYESVKEMKYTGENFLAPNITAFDPDFNKVKAVTKASISTRTDIPGKNPQLLSTTVAGNTYAYDIIFMTPDADEEFPGSTSHSVFGKDFGIIHFDEPDGIWFQPGADKLQHNDLKVAYSDHRPLWIRFKTNSAASDKGSQPLTFVGTAAGRKFHLPGCSTIANSTPTRKWTDREVALKERSPCKKCNP